MISSATSTNTKTKTVTECPKEESLKKPGNSEFRFSDVETITNNFSRPIGKGGFGQVFRGTLEDGTQVAVKVRSESSMQGAKALRAEVRLINPSSMVLQYEPEVLSLLSDTKIFLKNCRRIS